MATLKTLFRDQTWIAHLVGLGSITATQLASGNAVVSAVIAGLTAVFHVCQTFGNGIALPSNYVRPDTTLGKPSFGEPRVDTGVVLNASGTNKIEP